MKNLFSFLVLCLALQLSATAQNEKVFRLDPFTDGMKLGDFNLKIRPDTTMMINGKAVTGGLSQAQVEAAAADKVNAAKAYITPAVMDSLAQNFFSRITVAQGILKSYPAPGYLKLVADTNYLVRKTQTAPMYSTVFEKNLENTGGFDAASRVYERPDNGVNKTQWDGQNQDYAYLVKNFPGGLTGNFKVTIGGFNDLNTLTLGMHIVLNDTEVIVKTANVVNGAGVFYLNNVTAPSNSSTTPNLTIVCEPGASIFLGYIKIEKQI